jgi:hypothetical protein
MQAQGPTVITQELCWATPATPSVDSSIIGYYIYTGRSDTPLLVNYLDAAGDAVDVSAGGTIRVGACDPDFSALGSATNELFVYRLDQGEDYSLPLDTLDKYERFFFYGSGNDELNDTATISLPTFPDQNSNRYIGKRLFFHLQELTADSTSAVIITAPGDPSGSRLRQYNCYNDAVTSQNDTFTVTTEGIERLIEYTTVPRKATGDYFRECTGGSGGGSSSIAFDGDRPILRVPTAGVNIGSSTVTGWLNWWYFAPPTLSLSRSGGESTTVEVGTETTYTFTATTNNPGGATLSNGHLFVTGADTLLNFTSTTGGSAGLTFSPKQTPVDTFDNTFYQVRASQQWAEGAESGTIFSNAINLAGVYPVLYGMVADTATAFADPYGTLNKLVQTEGNKTVSFTGTGLIIYGFPQTWSDENLSSIIDPNGFNVTASFTRVTYPTVTSTGLTNNYVDEPYVFYFLNTGSTTTSSSNYTFNR